MVTKHEIASLDCAEFSGRRIGQEHPRAKFTDREVELTLWLREQGLSLSQIARQDGSF